MAVQSVAGVQGWLSSGLDVFPNRVVTYETWIALLLGQRDALPVWQRMLLLEADAVFGDVLPS